MDFLLMAAGFGSRLKTRTENLPKALVELQGKCLIDFVIDRAEELSWVDRLIVVSGFEREAMKKHLDNRKTRKPVLEIYNPEFQKGNFYSLLKGIECVGEEWTLLNVDHIYPRLLHEKCFEKREGVSAICDFDRPLLPDCMKVKLSADGKKIQSISKTLREYDGGYIGMTMVTKEGRDDYLDAVEIVRQLNNPNAYAEMVLQTLATTGTPPNMINASGFGWLEIDDERDYQVATETLANHPRFMESGI